jgi:hypothetical protein
VSTNLSDFGLFVDLRLRLAEAGFCDQQVWRVQWPLLGGLAQQGVQAVDAVANYIFLTVGQQA